MRLTDINEESIKKISNQELLSLHRRVHQLYILAKKKNNKKMLEFLKEKHSIISKEMEERGMKHKTRLSLKPITQKYLEGIQK